MDTCTEERRILFENEKAALRIIHSSPPSPAAQERRPTAEEVPGRGHGADCLVPSTSSASLPNLPISQEGTLPQQTPRRPSCDQDQDARRHFVPLIDDFVTRVGSRDGGGGVGDHGGRPLSCLVLGRLGKSLQQILSLQLENAGKRGRGEHLTSSDGGQMGH